MDKQSGSKSVTGVAKTGFIILILCCTTSVWGFEDVTLSEYIDKYDFIFLKTLMNADQMVDILKGTGPFTVFAPVDSAFTMVADDLDKLTDAQLQTILELHVVEGYILSDLIESTTNYTSWLGETISISPMNDTLVLNGISTVDEGHKDQIVNNGVIHRVDRVLLPPGDMLTTDTISQVFVRDDTRFQDLLLSLMIADLVDLLEGGDYTVFATSNAGFAMHAGNILDPSMEGAKELYEAVLKYHIVPGGRRSTKLNEGQLYTLQGEAITIGNDGTDVTVNGWPIVKKDIYAANGIIHMIDVIMLPPSYADNDPPSP